MKTRLLTLVAVAGLAMACTEEPLRDVAGPDPVSVDPAAVEITPVSPAAGVAVTFNSSGLGAGNRSWQFGDGTSDTGMVVQHVFADAGHYDVELTFDDGASAPDVYFVQLRVYGPGEDPADPEVETMKVRRLR